MNDIFEHQGLIYGTGLQLPPVKASAFPVYDDPGNGPMLTEDQIKSLAKDMPKNGRKWFNASFVKNQRSNGSCQGFASATATTKARVRRGLPTVFLSGAYAYSLVNGHQDNGSLLEAGMQACQQGYATEATVPWDAIYPERYDINKAKAEATLYKATEVYALHDYLDTFSAAASGFDLVIAVHVTNAFMSLNSDGIAGASRGVGNHAVSADGVYLTTQGKLALDGQNSWDVTYGDNGRMGMTWDDHLQETSKYHMFYAIKSSIGGSAALN